MRILMAVLVAAPLLAQPPYHGVVNGSPTFGASGVSNLSGTNFITLPAGVLNSACLTIEAYGNPANVSSWQWVLTNFPAGSPSITHGFSVGGAIFGSIGTATISTGFTLVAGTEYHLVTQECSGTLTYFVNGVNYGSVATAGPYASTSTARIGGNTNGLEIWSGSIKHLAIWHSARYTVCTVLATCFTPPVSYTGSEGMLAYYPLTTNANNFAGISLTAGTLAPALGLSLTAATGGTIGAGYEYQLESYAGACASGTFVADGAALTGQTGTAVFGRADGSTKCYRVRVRDSIPATVYSNEVTAPTGGTRSN